MNGAPIELMALAGGAISFAVMRALAGIQSNHAAGLRVRIGLTPSCLDAVRAQNLPGSAIMYKVGIWMPPHAPGVNHA